MNRHLSLALVAAGMLAVGAHAQAPGYDDLATAGVATAGQRPGVDFPMLEFDSRLGLLTSKARLLLHENGRTRPLGILDQSVLMASHDAYRFRDDGKDTPERARINFLDLSGDVGVKIALEHPRKSLTRRGEEIGRIRQRALFSIGTGIDVYEKGGFDRAIGYVDQKAGATLVDDVLRGFASFGLHTPDKVYTFYALRHREQAYTGWKKWKKSETVTEKVPLFRFATGKATGTGPGGVFLTASGQPVLAIKGDWWVSQNVFDLLVRRVDSEGTAGKALRVGGAILQVLADDAEGAADTMGEGQEFVRNSSAYLGSFLIGLVYFPEFRGLVGIDLPIAR